MAFPSLKAPVSAGGNYEAPDAGQYFARCFGIYDIGTQTVTSKSFGTAQKRQVNIAFELLKNMDEEDVRRDDGKPFVISQTFTFSMHERATLRKFIGDWLGRPLTEKEVQEFDLASLIGRPTLIQVVHKQSGDNTYANIGTIMTTKKSFEGVNPEVVFSVEQPDAGDMLDNLPQWLQEKVRGSLEWITTNSNKSNNDYEEAKKVFGVDDDESQPSQAEGKQINIGDVDF